MNELYEMLRTSILGTVEDAGERKQALDMLRSNTRISACVAVVPKFNEWAHPGTGEVRKYLANANEVFGFNKVTGEYALIEDTISYGAATALKGWIRQSKPYVNEAGELTWGRNIPLPSELRHIGGAVLVKIERHAQELITRHI
jgi:hypothetical protein